MQSQGCTQEWNPLQEHVGQNGNYWMDHECYPHMTIFYIFIYILFSPGNEARIHRCHYPSARFCLLPRRQEYCILKVSGLLFFLITNDLRRSDHSQLPWVEVPKTCFLERFEIQVQKAFYKHRVKKHHLYSFAAVAFLSGIFLVSVNIVQKDWPHLHYKYLSFNGLEVGKGLHKSELSCWRVSCLFIPKTGWTWWLWMSWIVLERPEYEINTVLCASWL